MRISRDRCVRGVCDVATCTRARSYLIAGNVMCATHTNICGVCCVRVFCRRHRTWPPQSHAMWIVWIFPQVPHEPPPSGLWRASVPPNPRWRICGGRFSTYIIFSISSHSREHANCTCSAIRYRGPGVGRPQEVWHVSRRDQATVRPDYHQAQSARPIVRKHRALSPHL